MEIRISLDEYADVPFIKKLLSQIKGVKNVEITEGDKTYSWEEIENSEYFGKVMEQSESYQELTDDLLDDLFSEKDENSIDNLLRLSLKQAEEGKVRELTPELLNQYFKK